MDFATLSDLKSTCISNLQDIKALLLGGNCIDTAVVRIESILEAIELVGQHHQIQWAPHVVPLLTQCISELDNSSTTAELSRTAGRPRIQVSTESIENLLAMNFKVTKVAHMLGTSRNTIFRRMAECGLSVGGTYTTISDDDLSQHVLQVLVNFPNTGYKRMKGFLFNRGVKVTERRVREVMRFVDPAGVYQRATQNRAIHRRQYYVDYSNQLWHLDTNLKLIRWNIVIRSCIDGKSRTVVYLDASGDNRADTNLASFMTAVSRYGIPLRTRSDKGGENVLIARLMLETRGLGRASHICGKSVHNQRIERLWRDVFYGCTGSYYSLFSKLEDDGYLDLDNPKHLYLLHWIFIPRMNAHLNTFMDAWNCHPISGESNYTPRQLMTMHLPPQAFDLDFQTESAPTLEFICNTPEDLDRFNADESITQPFPVNTALNSLEKAYLDSIDIHQLSNSFGYDIFANAVQALHWAPNE